MNFLAAASLSFATEGQNRSAAGRPNVTIALGLKILNSASTLSQQFSTQSFRTFESLNVTQQRIFDHIISSSGMFALANNFRQSLPAAPENGIPVLSSSPAGPWPTT